MTILLIFAFVSGLITIVAPCIWPLLPIILSSSTTGGRSKAFGTSLGIATSFAFFTLTLSYIVKIIPIDLDGLRLFAVIIILFLGLTLIIPKLTQLLEGFVSRLSASFGSKFQLKGEGFSGGYITGFALGIVWSPCAGPILATIAALAATRAVNFEIVLVTLIYAIGVVIPLFLFALGGNWLFTRSRFLSRYTGRIQQIFGVVMIATALLIATNYDKILQAKLLDYFPAYSQFLYKLEGQKDVKKQLDLLKQKKTNQQPRINLQNYGKAPEFTGIHRWLNSKPLLMSQLRGKVVLVDFWTYTCINCIRTLPYVRSWWSKYKDKGLVIVGVHTPEFEFEKDTENVVNAIKQYEISYPVAQDNDYETWNAYNNQYWPAKYLIDKDGNIRYFHFGEGRYEETELIIQKLLQEAGASLDEGLEKGESPKIRLIQTPETYLGSLRIDRFASPGEITGKEQSFSLPQSLPLHYFGLKGIWRVSPEYSQARKGSVLELNFYAEKVFLVITPKTSGDKIKIMLDGKAVGVLATDKARLYELIDLKGKRGQHLLRLEFQTDGTQIFAFTFD